MGPDLSEAIKSYKPVLNKPYVDNGKFMGLSFPLSNRPNRAVKTRFILLN